MSDQRQFWNERFGRDGYFYGTEPNQYLKSVIDEFEPQQVLLFLGEGEGRNAVYAAKKGHYVSALDTSEIGLAKTSMLAHETGCQVNLIHADLEWWTSSVGYDAVLCSFLHLTEPLRSTVFSKVLAILPENGIFAGEFFSIHQLPRPSGGPKDPELLYTAADLEKILSALPCEILELQEMDTELNEGTGHIGTASVVRMKVRKK